MQRTDSLEKTLTAGKDWKQEKGTTEDEMVGWHHQLDGHGFEWTLGVGSWWWTGRNGVLQFIGLQRVRHDWVTELNYRTSMQFGVNGVSGLCHLSHYLKPLICHYTVLCCASHFSHVRLCHLTSFPPSSLLSNWGQQCTSHEVARKTPRDHKCLTWPLTFTFITLLAVFYLQVGTSLPTLRLCSSVWFFTQERRKRLQWNFLYYESFTSPLLTVTNGGKDFI